MVPRLEPALVDAEDRVDSGTMSPWQAPHADNPDTAPHRSPVNSVTGSVTFPAARPVEAVTRTHGVNTL